MQPASEPPFGSNAILVVDDDLEFREAIRGALEERGFAVLTAANGREALEVLRKEGMPFLILLDLEMPVMNGWEFRTEIRRISDLASIPVIVMSAHVEGGLMAHPGGPDFRLRKPFGLSDLLAQVNRYAARVEGA